MRHTPYSVYQTFKSVEAEVKKKKAPKEQTLEQYEKRISEKNQELHKQVADLFNTRFSNVNFSEYCRCGFHHFKGFGFDKMFREIVLNEYISRDSRLKRKSDETLKDVLKSLKHINGPLEKYLDEMNEGQRLILEDYIFNRIGSTIVVYAIWRNLWKPTDIEWEYMNVIQSNWAAFEKNVVKYAPMIDKWRKEMKKRK